MEDGGCCCWFIEVRCRCCEGKGKCDDDDEDVVVVLVEGEGRGPLEKVFDGEAEGAMGGLWVDRSRIESCKRE